MSDEEPINIDDIPDAELEELSKLAEKQEQSKPESSETSISPQSSEQPALVSRQEKHGEGDTVILSTSNLQFFSELIGNLLSIRPEGEIVFKEDFIQINLKDISNVYMAETTIFKTVFNEMNKPPFPIIINFKQLHDLIKSKDNKSLELVVTKKEELIAHIKGKYKKKGNIDLISETDRPPTIKQIKWEVSILTGVKDFQSVLNEISSVFGTDDIKIIFEVRDKRLYAMAQKDKKWIEIDLNVDVNCERNFKAGYNMKFFGVFMGLNKICDKAELVFGENLPVLMKFMKQNAFVMKGVIAPRIDNDN